MNIVSATKAFEEWLRRQTLIVRGDLWHKHEAMGASRFCFLRATYYRWAQQFGDLDKAISVSPRVLSVGDLHLENFGTWRDGIGRLAWGINDFDEAYPLPYTNDLVRLATSALLAIEENHLNLSVKEACRAIAMGYREGIAAGGRPFVIGDEHRWFKPILASPERDPGLFWDRLRGLPRERGAVPSDARAAIVEMLPDRKLEYQVHHRIAGLGNLGKARYTAIANWLGGPVAREVKAVTLSAAAWAMSQREGPFYAEILRGAIRSRDPFLKAEGKWVTRRLSPDSRRLELGSLIRVNEEEWLLHAMGFETANVHLGTRGARAAIALHLKGVRKGTLREAAMMMRDMLVKDFRRWATRGGERDV
jgi:hypothetical protein